MTPEQQNIKLAGVFGIRKTRSGWLNYEPCVGDLSWTSLPNFSEDLHAIQKLEAKLTHRQQELYADILTMIVFGHDFDENQYNLDPDRYIGYIELPAEDVFKVITATATQRAEGLLRAMGLWEETS